MLPFTRQQFFEVFGAYNAEFWPAAVVAYLLALAALVFAWRGTRQAGRIVAAVLAIMWSWVGVVYLGQFFSAINPISHFFSIAFIVQAGVFT